MPTCSEIPDFLAASPEPSAAPAPAPPEKYDITIIVRPHGDSSIGIETEFHGINRSDILRLRNVVPAVETVRTMVEFYEAATGGRDADPS